MRGDACRRSSVIPAPSPALLWVKIKSFLEAMMETYGYGRFVCDYSNDTLSLYSYSTDRIWSLTNDIDNVYNTGRGER